MSLPASKLNGNVISASTALGANLWRCSPNGIFLRSSRQDWSGGPVGGGVMQRVGKP